MGRRENSNFKFQKKEKSSLWDLCNKNYTILGKMGELDEREWHFPSLTQGEFVLTNVVFYLYWSFWAWRFSGRNRSY